MRSLATAALAAVVLAGCGGDDEQREQLRAGELTALSARVAALRDAIVTGERFPALDAVVRLRETAVAISPRLAPDERRALRVAVRRIAARVRADLPPPEEDPATVEEQSAAPAAPAEEGDDEGDEGRKPGKGKGKAKGKKDKD